MGNQNIAENQRNLNEVPVLGVPKKKRFAEVTPAQVDQIAANNHAPKTKRQTNWGVKVFRGKYV